MKSGRAGFNLGVSTEGHKLLQSHFTQDFSPRSKLNLLPQAKPAIDSYSGQQDWSRIKLEP